MSFWLERFVVLNRMTCHFFVKYQTSIPDIVFIFANLH